MRTVKNIDAETIFKSTKDSEFIDFVKNTAIENQDFECSILGVADAEEYLEEYCPDLKLF